MAPGHKREEADSLIGGVQASLELAKGMTASGSTEGLAEVLSIASVCAQTALVLAVQELTDTVEGLVIPSGLREDPFWVATEAQL